MAKGTMNMEERHLTVATTELNKARACLDEMKLQIRAEDIIGFQENWSKFLTHICRCYNNIKHGSRERPAKGWFDIIVNVTKNDSLLSYIYHARNVDEHGIEEITLEVLPKPIGTGMVVGVSGISILVMKSPHVLKLVQVRNRNVIYDLPKEHLGNSINSRSIFHICELTIEYYQGIIREAERFVGKN